MGMFFRGTVFLNDTADNWQPSPHDPSYVVELTDQVTALLSPPVIILQARARASTY